jgi:hypothetical protein
VDTGQVVRLLAARLRQIDRSAEARKDDAEYRRLFEASALRTWRSSEHLLVEQALHVLALLYAGEQLDAAAGYFFVMWQMDDVDPPQSENWLLSAQACAYFFAANADAWRQFCSELSIAPEDLTDGCQSPELVPALL